MMKVIDREILENTMGLRDDLPRRCSTGTIFKRMEPSKTVYVVGCLNIHLTVKEKREELINFISSRADVDILGICETWFKPGLGKEVMTGCLENSEYEWYGLDRKKQTTKQGDGGVGFLIRKRVGKIEIAKSHLENDILG